MDIKVFLCITVSLLLFAGCITQNSINEDIQRTGQKAFTKWDQQQDLNNQTESPLKVRKEEDESSEPLLHGDLSLIDATKIALQFNRQLQIQIEERAYGRGEMKNALGNALPSITANGEYLREEDKAGFVVDGEQVNVGSLDSYSATLSIEQPLFTGGQLASALRSAKYYKVLTEKNIQAAIEETIYQVVSDYYQLQLLEQELEVDQNLVELNKQLLQDVQNNLDAGVGTEFNVLVAKVDLSNAQTQRQISQNNVDQAEAQLLRTLGASQTSDIKLANKLTYNPININREEAVQQALTNRPEIASSQMNLKIQEEVLRSSYSQYLPTISAYFDNSWGKPNPAFNSVNEWGRFWNAGIRVSWDIFNLSREGVIQQERANLRQEQISFYDTREAILYEVQSALAALDNARRSIETQQLTLKQADEGLRQARVGLREGTLTQVEVQEAQQTFSDAQLSYLNSLYNYEVARLDLQRAMGELRFNNHVDSDLIDDLQN